MLDYCRCFMALPYARDVRSQFGLKLCVLLLTRQGTVISLMYCAAHFDPVVRKMCAYGHATGDRGMELKKLTLPKCPLRKIQMQVWPVGAMADFTDR